jgi:hypothetical protein
VAKVIRLAETENKSAGEKALLLSLVEDLNEAVPDLNLAYDEMTGTLNMTAEEMKKVTSAMIDQARQAAQIERLTEIFKEQIDLQYQLGEAQDRVTQAQNDYNAAVAAHDYKAAQEATKALTEAKEDVQSLTEALTENAEAQAAATDAVNEFAAASGNASGATQELTASQAASAEAIMASLGSLTEAYNAAYDSALSSINNTISGFDEMAATVPTDVQTVIDALETQSSYIDTYMENLSKAAEMGLDDGLIAALSDGSRESAEILAGIVEDGGAKVQELNEKFREVQQGKEDFASIVAEMQTDFDTAADAMVEKAAQMVEDFNNYAGAYAAGASTIQGYIDGLNSRIADVNKIIGGGQPKKTIPKTQPPKNAFTHAQGLDRIPYDGYFAILHEDEMVLNRARASEYRAEQRARQTSVTNSKTTTVINHNSFFVPTKEAYDDIADYIDGKWGR